MANGTPRLQLEISPGTEDDSVLEQLGLQISHHITCKFHQVFVRFTTNIIRYLYGGLGFGPNATGFDDVYILSLPSFQWIKWWHGSFPEKPHHSLTCNIVNSGQMLIIGGSFPLSGTCDSPPTWGTHNLDLGKQSGKVWNDYQLNLTSYVVPSEIVARVGGSSLGGATATAPVGGFNDNDLSVYFQQRASVASRTPTRAIPTPSNSTTPTDTSKTHKKHILSAGAIAGIAIGGIVFLIALPVAGYCLIRHHRHKNRPQPASATYPDNSSYSRNPPALDRQAYHMPETPLYQLHATSMPAELPNNTFDQSRDPKKMLILQNQAHERDHPVYWAQNVSPAVSSPLTSLCLPVTDVNTNTMDTMYSQTSPVPSYSSTSRSLRRPTPQNQTYYSP